MISEVFEYLLTRASPEVREFGYLYASIGLQSRSRFFESHWKSHIDRCQSYFIKSMEKATHSRSVLILGSGVLAEIPMKNLLERFEKIYLVDVVHPRKIKAKYFRNSQVIFLELDLTGMNQVLWKATKYKELSGERLIDSLQTATENFNSDVLGLPSDIGMVFSANLLSQLPLVPTQFLLKKEILKSQGEVQSFFNLVQTRHIELLMNFKCPSVLISDIKIKTQNEEASTLALPLPNLQSPESWQWEIVPERKKNLGIGGSNFVRATVVAGILD